MRFVNQQSSVNAVFRLFGMTFIAIEKHRSDTPGAGRHSVDRQPPNQSLWSSAPLGCWGAMEQKTGLGRPVVSLL